MKVRWCAINGGRLPRARDRSGRLVSFTTEALGTGHRYSAARRVGVVRPGRFENRYAGVGILPKRGESNVCTFLIPTERPEKIFGLPVRASHSSGFSVVSTSKPEAAGQSCPSLPAVSDRWLL